MAPAPAPPRFDIVTVVFADEIALLRLQARSLARFFAAEAINSILVIVNDRDEEDCVAAVQGMAGEYGALQDRLRIVRPQDLAGGLPEGLGQRIERAYVAHVAGRLRAATPWRSPARRRAASGGWRGNKGWTVQQAFKLMAVRVCTGSHVLILDAKNHFVAPVGRDDLIAPDGRTRTRAMLPYDQQKARILASFGRLGFAADLACARAIPTVTPLAIERGLMDQAVALIRQRLGPIDLFFARRSRNCTEFMLLFAAVDQGRGDWWTLFADGLFASVTVFTRYGADNIPGLIAKATEDQARMFGLHRSALQTAPDAARRALFDFWTARGLLRSAAEGATLFALPPRPTGDRHDR